MGITHLQRFTTLGEEENLEISAPSFLSALSTIVGLLECMD
jgi:hypothetical protein